MKFVAICLSIVIAATGLAQRTKPKLYIGQAIDTTRIYAAPNSKSKIFFTAKQYQYLYVGAYSERYLKVKMSNNVYGYAKINNVAVLKEVSDSDIANASASRSRSSESSRAAAAQKGLKYIGTPYVWGGNDINNGIDCSGFVKKLYGDIGMNLPRTAAEQAKVGQPITRLENLRKGDRLYFWENKRNTIGHTGIYLGNGYFVHSSRGHNGVNTDLLTEKWLKILVAARR
ncbi:MAG: C40 family peptidase [Fimbriimonas sp.]|jgi:cell wall-associated NlpC family hydrolase|nr:C40 family peptidase [Fimbriimonadales bacterium]